jgi:hypothetical protein
MATTGFPKAIASRRTMGSASVSLVRQLTSAAHTTSTMSLRFAEYSHCAAGRPREGLDPWELRPCSRHESYNSVVCRVCSSDRLDEQVCSLLGSQGCCEYGDERVRGNSQLCAHLLGRALGCECRDAVGNDPNSIASVTELDEVGHL